MDMSQFELLENEQPLDRLVTDGGMCGIFRTVACIGDSLSSGEFEVADDEGHHFFDRFDYSWGQFMAREAGMTVYNFSRGGMTAKEYVESFAEQQHFFDPQKAAQAYIIAMGANDFFWDAVRYEAGTKEDICKEDPTKNKKTYMGYMGQIISRYREISPDAKFFLVTFPNYPRDTEEKNERTRLQVKLMYDLAEVFDNTYVIDLYRYAPVYDEAFKSRFFMNGHMNPTGYRFTAKLMLSYIDWYIRRDPEDFREVGLIGTPWKTKK